MSERRVHIIQSFLELKINYSDTLTEKFYFYTLTSIILSPKNVDNREIVLSVKLCWPLSHLVISLGRLPSLRANSSLVRWCFFIRLSIRFEISISKSISCFTSGGTCETIWLNNVLIVFIGQRFYRFWLCFRLWQWSCFWHLLLSVCQIFEVLAHSR